MSRMRDLFATARREHDLQNKWLSAEVWTAKLNSMDPLFNINQGEFNRFMFDQTFGFPCCENLLSSNTSGVFRMVYGRNTYLYYVTIENGRCDKQKLCLEWINQVKHDSVVLLQSMNLLATQNDSTINNNNNNNNDTAVETTTTSPSHTLLSTPANASSKKNLSVYHPSSNILNDKRQ